MHTKEKLIVDEDAGHAGYVVTREREPAPGLDVWRGCGPERGAWEDRHANDNAVVVEYEAPPARTS